MEECTTLPHAHTPLKESGLFYTVVLTDSNFSIDCLQKTNRFLKKNYPIVDQILGLFSEKQIALFVILVHHITTFFSLIKKIDLQRTFRIIRSERRKSRLVFRFTKS